MGERQHVWTLLGPASNPSHIPGVPDPPSDMKHTLRVPGRPRPPLPCHQYIAFLVLALGNWLRILRLGGQTLGCCKPAPVWSWWSRWALGLVGCFCSLAEAEGTQAWLALWQCVRASLPLAGINCHGEAKGLTKISHLHFWRWRSLLSLWSWLATEVYWHLF